MHFIVFAAGSSAMGVSESSGRRTHVNRLWFPLGFAPGNSGVDPAGSPRSPQSAVITRGGGRSFSQGCSAMRTAAVDGSLPMGPPALAGFHTEQKRISSVVPGISFIKDMNSQKVYFLTKWALSCLTR